MLLIPNLELLMLRLIVIFGVILFETSMMFRYFLLYFSRRGGNGNEKAVLAQPPRTTIVIGGDARPKHSAPKQNHQHPPSTSTFLPHEPPNYPGFLNMPLSDTSLTVSDFDPEHEALASTREIGSPRLPNMLPDMHDDEPDWAVNTSTIDRAFPEFSQLPSEEEADEEEMFDNNSEPSMELGRGVGKSGRRLDDSRDSVMSFQNSVRSSSPAVRVEYPTPQKSMPARSNPKRAVSENLRKDAQLRRATQAQKEHMMSPQVSKNQRDQRRSLSDMHAKVRDNYDGSFLGDERPAPVETKSRSTRFASANQSQEIADAIERVSREAYAREIRKGNSAGARRPVANATHTNNMGDTMTRNSFLLPDLASVGLLSDAF